MRYSASSWTRPSVFVSVFGSIFCASIALFGTVSCQRSAEKPSDLPAEKLATIRVLSGNGRLAGGEEYSIAEWRSGLKSADQGAFADFRGQDGGPTLDLSLQGLNGVGEFVCGGAADLSGASLELRVDVNNAYRAAADAPCEVEVERVENGVMEGRYTATLRHTGNPSDEMTVAGTFRASVPGASGTTPKPAKAEIEAAKGPKILGR